MQEQINIVKKQNLTKEDFIVFLLKRALNYKMSRKVIMDQLKKIAYKNLVLNNKSHPRNVQIKKYYFFVSILESANRSLEKGHISKDVAKKAIDSISKNFFWSNELLPIYSNFYKKYGKYPPTFIVLAPTQKCNLNCVGCYASAKINAPMLKYEILDKIFKEVHDEWGNRFMTITGGEPLIYNDNGKTLFDLWKKYNDMYFLFYTNGTLITKEVAKKLAQVGNAIPGISIEGYEKETDCRRGKGVYKRILESIKNLKEAGVPFCVSVTATKNNYELLANDEYYDYVFNELGAIYMWMFQLMPIGKAKDLKELMLTPDQRVNLYRKWEHLIKNKKYPVADFWNSGVLTDGCIAYGRDWGYMYIDWNGNIPPCVFVPFYEDNVINIYNQGGKLADSLFSNLFINGRKWQDKVGFSNPKHPDNWLMPCSIRDHYSNFKKNILTEKTKPEDVFAAAILKSPEYGKVLEEFDKELTEKTLPIWKKEYLEE